MLSANRPRIGCCGMWMCASSGGGRTIYYVLTEDEVLYLITAYAKVDKDDLQPNEIKLFKALIEELTDDR